MSNNSSQPVLNRTATDIPYYLSERWVAFQTAAAVLWLLSAYLLLSLILSEVRWRRRNRVIPAQQMAMHALRQNHAVATVSLSSSAVKPNGSHSGGSVRDDHKKAKVPAKRRKSMISSTLLLCASAFAFLYCCITFVDLHAGWYSDVACQATYALTAVVYALSIGSVYTILWDRQRRLYNTPAIGHLSTRCLKLVSASTLAVTVISSLTSIVILNVSARGASSPRGCVRVTMDLPRWTRIVILPVLAVAQQVLLLGLVIYPLKKQVRNVGNCLNRASNFHRLMKRLAISTGVCVASDTALAVALLIFSGEQSSGIVGQLLTSVNLLVNVVSVTSSFATWKEKLFFGSTKKGKSVIEHSSEAKTG